MNTRKHIETRTERAGLKVPVSNLNRYVRGDRTPSLKVAETICRVVRSPIKIWLDRTCKKQRIDALKLYAERHNLRLQLKRGRPCKTGGKNA